MPTKRKKNLRSQQWFNNPKDPEMTLFTWRDI